MIARQLTQLVKKRLFSGKAIIITGSRQVGKTTLLHHLMESYNDSVLFINCDEPEFREALTNVNSQQLRHIIGPNKLVIIDEAQRVSNIGITLKLIIDNFRDIQLIVSGSSALELSNKIFESLTGRKFEYQLYPFSVQEMCDHHTRFTESLNLETRLIFGMYPDIVNHPGDEKEILTNLSTSYLYKDLFNYQDVRKPELLTKLLEALALQVGSTVNYNELGQIVGASFDTVLRYVTLLEQSFIIFRLRCYSRNIRNELKKSRKIYFYDNGIRNAIIGNFNPLGIRNDVGALFENYLISERSKWLHYNRKNGRMFFWRSRQKQEVDYVEKDADQFSAFEFKYNEKKSAKLPSAFQTGYPNVDFQVINRKNYMDFLTEIQ